nr:ribonuclease P protein component [Bacteroides sp.]
MTLRLYKKEKLCSATAIDALFAPGSGSSRAMGFPVRAVWRENTRRHADCPQFLIMVPKKRLRHAVDRVTMRRRIREAYRLNRHLIPADRRLDIAFIYVASELRPYADVERGMTRVLSAIGRSLAAAPPAPEAQS